MNDAQNTPESWRNFSAKVPIQAFHIRRDELNRLYQIIHEKQVDYRDRVMSSLSKLANELDEEFERRKQRVHNAFVTSVTVTDLDGEMVHGNNEQFFDSTTFPSRLRSIFIATKTIPQAVLNFTPLCNIVVFLDFSRPPLLDFARLPTLPTPNESNFELAANDELWFAAAKKRLDQFFAERKTSTNWLHAAAVYDVFLAFVGIPIGIWASYRIGNLFNGFKFSPFISTAIYIYGFALALLLFRVFFSYSRWVFPKVALDTELSSPLRHRGVWSAILVGLIVSLIYDFLKALL